MRFLSIAKLNFRLDAFLVPGVDRFVGGASWQAIGRGASFVVVAHCLQLNGISKRNAMNNPFEQKVKLKRRFKPRA